MMDLAEDPQCCKNTEVQTWLPIWVAWKTFYDRLQDDLNNGLIKNRFINNKKIQRWRKTALF